MPQEIPDWKKAAIIVLSPKYGYRAIGNRLDIDFKTAREYIKEADETGIVEMAGTDLKIKNAS